MPSLTRAAAVSFARFCAGPLWLLYACTALIITSLAGADIAVLANLHEATLRNTETNLSNISLALAEQADRAVQGLDLVLNDVARFVSADGADTVASFQDRMAEHRVHDMLHSKLVGLPYINAITMISVDGRLINFSRYWPIPSVNVSDRDYFDALRVDPRLQSFISEPVANRGDGAWTVYLARRAPSRDGNFIGLLLGAIELRYFEDFYRSVSLGEGSAISLMRWDGIELARYPPAAVIGRRFAEFGPRALQGGVAGVMRDVSPVDGTQRIKAARKLTNFPMLVLVTKTEAAALREWHSVAWVLSLITASCAAAILVATFAVARRLQQQQALGRARAERAEAERARAVAETELLRERERDADAENRAKSGFLAMMSHEIRTPMNAVLGLAGTLLDGTLTPPQRDVVKAIRDSGDSLLRILNDILDFSKLDAGRVMLEPAPFSPERLTQHVISILGPRAAAKSLAIVAESDADLPAGLCGDAGRIRQVLLNIVSNAVKFTGSGSIVIRVSCVGREGDQATIEWSVRDTGIGIAPDRIGNLFQEFVQADRSINRRFGGSGLGLAISKRLVDQMGGSITVDSDAGVGTTFRVHLTLPVTDPPLDVVSPVADVVRALENRLSALGRSLRVLFAEDNPTNQFVVRQLLKGLPLQIDLVGDGLEAVDAASSYAYDMIFMDMRMPEMDGLTATRLIRKRAGSLARVPIIALTANAFPEDVRACFDAGMSQFITKPVSRDMLLAAILRAMTDPEARQIATAVPSAESPSAPFDVAAMQALIADLGDGVVEMLDVFEHETDERLRRMADPAIPSTTLLREAHGLKGAAGTVCAPFLCQLAADLEQRLRAGGKLETHDLARLGDALGAFRAAVDASGVTSRAAA